jgi:photosystem II stability/assembly factor-like uncharacterized protein
MRVLGRSAGPRESPFFWRLVQSVLALLGALVADGYAEGVRHRWISVGPALRSVRAIVIGPSSSTLFAGTDGGVFRSDDGAESWIEVDAGLADTDIYSLAVDPGSPSLLYAGTHSGAFRSADGGASWSPVEGGFASSVVLALVADPSSPSTFYLGATTERGAMEGHVFKSADGGSRWAQADHGISTNVVYALAIDPSLPSTLYAGTEMSGAFRSVDFGAHWRQVSAGLNPVGFWMPPSVHALAIDPSRPETLYAGTDAGVAKSADRAETWRQSSAGLPPDSVVYAIQIDPVVASTLYAAVSAAGVFRSLDGGGNWESISEGLTNLYVTSLAFDPSSRSTIYVGTGGGIFRMNLERPVSDRRTPRRIEQSPSER